MNVLIIDNSVDTAEILSLCFGMRWPNSIINRAATGAEGIQLVKEDEPDLIILEATLPDIDGYEVCRSIRSFSNVLIFMLSVRNEDKDIIKGLETGADGYMTKPFSHLQFLAQIQALLRRTLKINGFNQNRPFVSNNLMVNFDMREVRIHNNLVKLTNIEFNLLSCLVRNPGRPLSKTSLLEEIWGPGHDNTPYLLKVHIQHLREKIEEDFSKPRYVLTERGVGYKFSTIG
jgi:DNA-binding response OmpR family regulator